MKNKVLLGLVVIAALACSKKKEDDPAPKVKTSSSQWSVVKKNDNDTILVKNGYLYLSTTTDNAEKTGTGGKSATAGVITSDKLLVGDFELEVKFSGIKFLAATDVINTLNFVLLPEAGGSTVNVTGVNKNAIYFYKQSAIDGKTNKLTTPIIAGTYYAKRTGTSVLVRITSGDQQLEYTVAAIDTPLKFEMILGAGLSNISYRTSAQIDDFKILSGGGNNLSSDTFDVNSL